MDLKELEEYISIMLNQLRVSSRVTSVMRGVSSQFIIEDFGLIICCIDRVDYAQASNSVNENFRDWRAVYITTNDDLVEVKDKILWVLMRGGYMKWLRYNFPRQVKNTLVGVDNLGRKIITERLRLWNNKPKYKFFIEDNLLALKNGVQRELVNDPSFFDYMPEEE
jgi:hypothetical protein